MTYEYYCKMDNKTFQVDMPAFAPEDTIKCPECGRDIHRKYESIAVHYNAKGFTTGGPVDK